MKEYKETALRARSTVEVRELTDALMKIHTDSEHYGGLTMPFVVLENSSGTGKTQMAFNLMTTEACDVFHVTCTPQTELHQQVYGAFEARRAAFDACVTADAGSLESGFVSEFNSASSLMLYSFIVAAVTGTDSFSGKKTRGGVRAILEKRRENNAKPFVFFLDEFPRVDNLTGAEKEKQQKRARLMRNVFRSFHIPIVISATNGTARDLLSVNSYRPRGATSST